MTASVIESLEAAILADRDDVELYLVYADELQRRGDPRGELMVMQNQIQAIEDKQQRRALQRTCDKFIAKHDLLGPLRDFDGNVKTRHSVVTWRYGFIRCLEVGWGPDAPDTPADARDTLEQILAHPSSTFITWLVLGPAPSVRKQMSMQCLVDALVAAKPRALRTLYLGKINEWPRNRTATGDIGAASATLGHLQKLTLDAGAVTLGALALPELVELRISCFELTARNLEELGVMRCPKLRKLEIEYDLSALDADDLKADLRARYPKCRSIKIGRARRSDF